MQAFISSDNNLMQKYNTHRNEFKNGDIVLYHGTSMMAKAIQYFDNAYFNHAGIVWIPENSNRVLTLDMWQQGLMCLPLSRRMAGYADFCVLRPKFDFPTGYIAKGIENQNKINIAVNTALGMWDGREVKYNYAILLRIALIKKTGIDITGLGKKDTFICSQFVQYYTSLLGFSIYEGIKLITPEDFLRFIDENFEILFK